MISLLALELGTSIKFLDVAKEELLSFITLELECRCENIVVRCEGSETEVGLLRDFKTEE